MKNKISKHLKFRAFTLFFLFTWMQFPAPAQVLPGFTLLANQAEQESLHTDPATGVTVCINAPLHFAPEGKTCLVIFALPNGNSIEWTKGKKMKPGDDWHFDIQHIAAQTRLVRKLDKRNNYIVVYLMSPQKSWPAWKRTTSGSVRLIKAITDSLAGLFAPYHPVIYLNGHSGGGSYIFGYLDAADRIPDQVERIAFLDSDYGFTDSLHTEKITDWLRRGNHHLVVLAYNDSVVFLNGKPVVSPTGGTWYRSRLMHRKLAENFSFSTTEDTAFIRHKSTDGRIRIYLKKNPGGLIYHTVQVERNGFIFSLLSNTKYEKRKYFTYFGKRAYEKYIEE